MGSVFDKDILYGGLRLDEEFTFGKDIANAATMILYDAKVLGEIETDIGMATKTGLVVARMDSPTEAFAVGTLSQPIAARFATVDNLRDDPRMPAVVAVFKTDASVEGHNDPTVLQYVRTWDGDTPETLPPLAAVSETPL